jgi:hypothetical protein
MPRKSPYTLSLTAAQRHELQTRARKYTLPYRDVIRAKIVLMAAESGQPRSDTGKRRGEQHERARRGHLRVSLAWMHRWGGGVRGCPSA